jgi:hypothetical protein
MVLMTLQQSSGEDSMVDGIAMVEMCAKGSYHVARQGIRELGSGQFCSFKSTLSRDLTQGAHEYYLNTF